MSWTVTRRLQRLVACVALLGPVVSFSLAQASPPQDRGLFLDRNQSPTARNKQDKPKTEFVMTPGMVITATNDVGTMAITADDELTRSYTWEGATRSVEMYPRGERWFGSLGIYYPGPGNHWKPHNGIARGVVEECQRHFETVDEALAYIYEANEGQNSYNGNKKYAQYYVYRDDGLVVGWGKTFGRKQLDVDVWQIMIGGQKPKDFPGARNDAIAVSEVKRDTADDRLVEAVRKNDLSKVRELLDQGADPNAKAGGATVLLIAAKNGKTEIAQVLLDKKADLNAKDDEGATALMLAAGEGHVETIKALLAKGADINAAQEQGMSQGATALVMASKAGQARAAEALLEAGADAKAEMSDGKTALHTAAMMGHAEVAELLLAKGAEVDARDWLGMTPLMYAAMVGRLDVAKLLVAKGADVNAKSDGTRARYGLLRFSDGSAAEQAAKAIEKSGKLKTRQEDGLSVLMWARGPNNKELVELLKKAGAK